MTNPLDDMIAKMTDDPSTEAEFDDYLDMITAPTHIDMFTDPSELPPLPFRQRLDHAYSRLDNWIIPGQFNALLDDRLKGIFDLMSPRLDREEDRVQLIERLNAISRMRR